MLKSRFLKHIPCLKILNQKQYEKVINVQYRPQLGIHDIAKLQSIGWLCLYLDHFYQVNDIYNRGRLTGPQRCPLKLWMFYMAKGALKMPLNQGFWDEIVQDYPGGPRGTTGSFSEGGGGVTVSRGVMREAEVRDLKMPRFWPWRWRHGPQVKRCRQPLKTGKGEKHILPRASKKNAALATPWLYDFCFQNCKLGGFILSHCVGGTCYSSNRKLIK